jgi:hypothetical protein
MVESRNKSGSYMIIPDPVSSQSTVMNKLEGPPSSALSFIGGVHIGSRALHVLNLIWFGCVARLSH